MKSPRIQVILLSVLIFISLFLTYMLVFDTNFLYSQWINRDQGVQLNIQNDSNTQITSANTSNLALSDMLVPIRINISAQDQGYFFNNHETFQEITSNMLRRRISISGQVIKPDAQAYQSMISQERVELEFSNEYPLGLASSLIRNVTEGEDFSFNRIIYPNKKDRKVYLVNTITHQYLEGNLSEGILASQFFEEVSAYSDDWVKALRYSLSNGSYTYLPMEGLEVASQVYTLDRVSETLIIDSLFGTNRSWRYDASEQDNTSQVVTYYNANLEASINLGTQQLSITYKNGQYEAKNLLQRIEQALGQVRNFEYWNQGIRYSSQSNSSSVVFQRYLNGLPIFTSPAITQYSADRVQFRGGNLNSSISRLTVPLVFLEAHVADLSQNYQLAGMEEILYELNLAGFVPSNFTNIVVGYEWQEEMANFQKVTFIPKWFFEWNGVYYSLDQIKNGEVKMDNTSTGDEEDSSNQRDEETSENGL